METMTPRQPVSVFNIPNQLTTSRLFLAVVLFVLIAVQSWLWCLAVFCLAALTDYLDGYVARLQGLSTSLGRILDPLVDKVLMCGAFIFLLPEGNEAGWLTPWMVTVVVGREFLITGLRSYIELHGVQFGADWLGKLKMGLQCAAVMAIFVSLHFGAAWLGWCRDVLIWSMLAATILSGLQYVIRGLIILRSEPDKASL